MRTWLPVVLTCAVGNCLSGCAAPVEVPGDPDAQVICLRGLCNVFSLGLDELAAELQARGVPAEVHPWPPAPPQVLSAALSAAIKDVRVAPLILVGHSTGADDAIRLARALRQHDVTVDLLVLLDATDPPLVPANVARCLHLYIPTQPAHWLPRAFPGNPVELEPGNERTELVNHVVTIEEFGSVDHFTLEENPRARQIIMEEVLALGQSAR